MSSEHDRKKTKILFLIDELNPGGSERQLLQLADGLSRTMYSPAIGVLDRTDFQDSLNIKTPIFTFAAKGFPFIKSLIRLGKLRSHLKREKYDIVQLYFQTASVLGVIASFLLPCRPYLIGTRRNLYHWVAEEKYALFLTKATVRWVDHIIANSFSVVSLVEKLEGVRKENITVIDNGVELSKYQKVNMNNAKKDLGLKSDVSVVGVVGNWRPVKGSIVFLHACAKVAEKYPSVQFVMAGSGKQKNELIALSEKLGICDRVKFIEGRTDIYKIIPAFDVAVQPSLSESFSNVLIEYMASGLCVVATNVGDASRIIENNKEGLVVHPDDADSLSEGILFVLGNPEKAAKMAVAAREKTEINWSMQTHINNYDQFYQKARGIENAR